MVHDLPVIPLAESHMVQCGKYQLLYKIAQGGMAEILAADSPANAPPGERRICIKRIRSEFSDDPEFLRMFEQEARIAMALEHPNIVRVFEFDSHRDRCFLAMEWVDGWDLKKIITAAKEIGTVLPVGFAFFVAGSVLGALDAAASVMMAGKQQTIVHRDISPHNILVSRTGAVKLTDFGIARARGSSRMTRTGVLKGKLTYLAPQQATGGEVGPGTDMYSLGLVLYEMLTGERFHKGASEGEILASVMSPPPVTIPWLSAEINRFLSCLLAPNVDERFPSAAAAAVALGELLLPGHTSSDASQFLFGLITSAASGGTRAAEPVSLSDEGEARQEYEARENGEIRQGAGTSGRPQRLWLVSVAAMVVLIVAGLAVLGPGLGKMGQFGTDGRHISFEGDGSRDTTGTADIVAETPEISASEDVVVQLANAVSSNGETADVNLSDNDNVHVSTVHPESLRVKNSVRHHSRNRDIAENQGDAPQTPVRDNGNGDSAGRTDKANSGQVGDGDSATGRTGTLQVLCRPWAYVRVDGKPVGTTPIRNYKLKEGKHQLTLVNQEKNYRKNMTVIIRNDQLTKVSERIE